MDNCSFLFYPETNLKFVDRHCEITSPWMSAIIPLPQVVESNHEEWANLLARSLAGFPFVKILPKSKVNISLSDSDLEVENLWNHILQISNWDEPVSTSWNHIKIAEESYTSDGYCTLSAFSGIQKEMFSSFPDTGSINNLHSVIAALQQSYYVTSNCSKSLVGGIGFHGKNLENYIKSETGHHLIIEQALLSMNVKPSIEQVHWATIASIRLLTASANNYPFALCCCLSFFEQGSFYEFDPLAKTLLSLGQKKASELVNIHFSINKRETHHMIGFYLAQSVKISFQDLLIASMICEMLTKFSYQLNDYLCSFDEY